MAALIEAAKAGDFPAEIVVVISNRADAGGLATANASGIATLIIESKPFGKDRAAFEAALQAALDLHRVELICLGGFMRLLTAEFVQRWQGRAGAAFQRDDVVEAHSWCPVRSRLVAR